jgi:hypothetical protein
VARRVGREVKGVHGDLHALLDAGLLDRTVNGRVVFPLPRYARSLRSRRGVGENDRPLVNYVSKSWQILITALKYADRRADSTAFRNAGEIDEVAVQDS